jgi:D-arabinose 1-dehydrogenase-like Zn-dependent alcohol dehydrogenase
MANTYKAMEVVSKGVLQPVERQITDPGPGQVRIKVEACGVCHTDAATVEMGFPGITYPRVPGHEVIGHVDAIGLQVSRWRVGERVGLGFFGGEDGTCEPCRRGDFVNCIHAIYPGISSDGGYAEMVIAEARALASIPEDMNAAEAAPLLCAGITTFNALRNAGLRSGELVAVQGIGGLGHLGVQFAARMGFHTIAIGRGADKEPLAKKLGAHRYIDDSKEDTAAVLMQMGGASAILATAPDGKAMGKLVAGLKVRGKLLIVGAPSDPMQLNALPLIFGGRSVVGSLAGTGIDGEDTIAFSVLQNVRPMVETMPLAQAPEAYAKMMSGKARFRMVLVMS